jgi:shikimate dehydrogenase
VPQFVGILGYPLGHSISPIFQQAAFDHLGLDIRYQAWEVPPQGLAETVDGLRHPSRLGASVTIPHKEAVLPLMDELDPPAQRMGAVNTIAKRQGRLWGHNTDAEGFMRALLGDAHLLPEGKRVVLLGAGGAARAIAFALTAAGIGSLVIANRTLERAQALAREMEGFLAKIEVIPWEAEALRLALLRCHLLVNCTSIGMKGSPTEGQLPLEPYLIPKEALIYDIVYNPLETPLLREARRVRARTLGGLPMLVYQGAAAFRLWTGRAAPVDIMMNAAREALG